MPVLSNFDEGVPFFRMDHPLRKVLCQRANEHRDRPDYS